MRQNEEHTFSMLELKEGNQHAGKPEKRFRKYRPALLDRMFLTKVELYNAAYIQEQSEEEKRKIWKEMAALHRGRRIIVRKNQ